MKCINLIYVFQNETINALNEANQHPMCVLIIGVGE